MQRALRWPSNEEDYLEDVNHARDILKGNIAPVKQYFKSEMLKASDQMAFERAQEMKFKLEYLKSFKLNLSL